MAYGYTVDQVVADLRKMILRGDLDAGDHLRQDDLAHRLGVTRVPIREAFKTLVAEGMLVHRHNYGHFVARLSSDELQQIYWVRKVLENEVVRTSQWPRAQTLVSARALNDDIVALAANTAKTAVAVDEIVACNRALHFLLFDLSSKDLIIREIGRLWDVSEQYHRVYLYEPDTIARVVREHAGIIDALEARDRSTYRRLLTEHRQRGESSVHQLIEARDRVTPPVSG